MHGHLPSFIQTVLCILFLLKCGEANIYNKGRHKGRTHHPNIYSGRKTIEAAGPQSYSGSIPRILHHIYLPDKEAYLASTRHVHGGSDFRRYQSCLDHNKGWQPMFWDLEMAEKLLQEDFPWFFPQWQRYDLLIKKADVLRYAIMAKYGGLYLDMDVECFRSAEEMIAGYDVVLQGDGPEVLENGVIASRPGLELWSKVLQFLNGLSATGSVVSVTGPMALYASITKEIPAVNNTVGWYGADIEADGVRIKVYPLGELYQPCWWQDITCLKKLERGLEQGTLDTEELIGVHFLDGEWGPTKLPVQRSAPA